jgi:hypothetical protein
MSSEKIVQAGCSGLLEPPSLYIYIYIDLFAFNNKGKNVIGLCFFTLIP